MFFKVVMGKKPQIIPKTPEADNAQKPQVYPEKTWPTSMVIAFVAWSLCNRRCGVDMRKKAFELLRDLIDCCTGVLPEFHIYVPIHNGH